jgi:tetratricopeptide (TPR) repeat protein
MLLLLAGGAPGAAHATEPQDVASVTVIGGRPAELMAGAHALMAGDYAQGIELTLAGLARARAPRDRIDALANLCAGHVGLRQFDLALVRCSQSLEIDPHNWRALNNRALAWLGKGLVEPALADLSRGLAINPGARALRRSYEIALDMHGERPPGEASAFET